jgi:hypothetical protein
MSFHIAASAQAAVDLCPVPDDEKLAGKEAPELAEEGDDLGGADGSPVRTEADGATDDAGDGREFLPIGAELQNGRLADQRPDALPMGLFARAPRSGGLYSFIYNSRQDKALW